MKYLIILTIIFICSTASSVTPPLKRIKLTSSFGESRNDHFHNGVDFGSGEQDLQAIMDGKLIFYYDKSEFPFKNHFGTGNYIITDHNDKRAYYMHLKDNSMNYSNYIIKEGDYIARTADTGHSYGIHLHFGMESKYPVEVLNPLQFFKEHLVDNVSPVIEGLYTSSENDELIRIRESYTVNNQDTLRLYAKVYDLMQNNNNKMGIYKITCYINETKHKEYIFDKLIIKENQYKLKENLNFESVFFEKYIYNFGEIKLNSDILIIKITAEDFYGNQTQLMSQIIKKDLNNGTDH